MTPSKCLVLVAILLLSFQFQPPWFASGNSYATVCGKTGKYRANSTYQTNVQTTTSYLTNYPTFTVGTGFATVVPNGDSLDAVYGLALCRGDTPDNVSCYECLSTASDEAQILCPYYKDAALFYDGCVMRFSDQDFLSTTDNAPEVVLNSTETVKPAVVARRFDALVARLLNETAEHAAESQVPNKKMATGEAMFDAGEQTMKVYSLAQCTPDLTAAQCRRCLGRVMARAAQKIPGALGKRVAGVRCNVRFEVYPFYIGESMVRIKGLGAPSPAPLLPPPPPPPEVVTPVSLQSKGGTHAKNT